MKRIRYLFLSMGIAVAPIAAQVFSEVPFPVASLTGVAAANSANSNDLWSVFINPAGLSRITQIQTGAAYHQLYNLSFLSHQSAAVAVPLRQWGCAAVSYQSQSTQYTGVALTSESALRFSHSFFLQKDLLSALAVGYNVNCYHLEYGHSAGGSGDGSDGVDLGQGWGIGLDFGLQANLRERHWIGLTVTNAGNSTLGDGLSNHSLPKSITVGFAYEPYAQVMTSLAIHQPLGDFPTQYRGGLVYELNDWIVLRSGVYVQPGSLTLGFGLNRWGMQCDYAYLHHPVLPGTHQISCGYRFKAR